MTQTMPTAPGRRPFNPWPAGVVTAFILFALGVVTLIVVASSNRSELVTPDYYEQELRYQQQIDKLRRTRDLPAPAQVAFDPGPGRLVVQFPPDHARSGVTGRIRLYRPSAAGLDRDVPLAPDAAGRQVLGVEDLQPGRWKVWIEWQVAGEGFLLEEKIVVPARTR